MSLVSAAELLSPLLFAYLLTFCRIGAAFMLFPAFTDSVPQQSRLMAALAVSLPVSVLVGDGISQGEMSATFLTVVINVTVGIYLAVATRLLLAALHTSGQLMGQVSGLYNPFNSAGLAFEGSTIISTFMVLFGTALIFAADLHMHFISALTSSFMMIPLNGTIPPDIMSGRIISIISTSFSLAISFAAPFIVLGLVFNLALGVCNKMMPALPVFFVFSPILIFCGVMLIMVVFGSIASTFTTYMYDLISAL